MHVKGKANTVYVHACYMHLCIQAVHELYMYCRFTKCSVHAWAKPKMIHSKVTQYYVP